MRDANTHTNTDRDCYSYSYSYSYSWLALDDPLRQFHAFGRGAHAQRVCLQSED